MWNKVIRDSLFLLIHKFIYLVQENLVIAVINQSESEKKVMAIYVAASWLGIIARGPKV